MAYAYRLSIRIYPTDEDGVITSTNYTEIPDILSADVMNGIEATKDTFSFEIPVYTTSGHVWNNQTGLTVWGDRVIRPNDIITIFAGYGRKETFTDSNLIMMGVIKNFNVYLSGKKLRVQVKGVNRTEELLRGMIPYSTIQTTTNTKTPPDIIIDIINRLNNHNKNHKVYAFKTTDVSNIGYQITGVAGGIQATKKDGTAFNGVSYNVTWKPVYLQFEQLSSPDYTEDKNAGNYIYYIKPIAVLPQYQNNAPDGTKPGPFVDFIYWRNPSVNLSGTVIAGSQITDITASYDVREIVNAMIINAGKDLNDHGVTTVAYDTESMAKYGARWGYYTKSMRKFSKLFEQEVTLGTQSGSVFDAQTHFPPVGSYPWIMHFDGTPTATDDTTFNNLLREQAKTEAKDEALQVIEKTKNALWEITFDLEVGSNTLTMGDVHSFQIPEIGWEGTTANPARLLRLRDQTHTFNNAGWQTRITAREDEEVVRLQLQDSG